MLQVLALPAKRVGFFAVNGALIARSDSNGEDLEAFAGAGERPSPLPLQLLCCTFACVQSSILEAMHLH